MIWDAAIVGAGPAGASAAIGLAAAGMRVIVLEKSRMPRDKACGDAVSPRALHLLQSLAVPVSADPELSHVFYRRPCSKGSVSKVRAPECGAIIPRLKLDQLIAQRASDLGASIQDNTICESLIVDNEVVKGVRVRSRGVGCHDIRAHVTLIAEGAVDGLARSAPLASMRRHQSGFAVRKYLGNVEWGGTCRALEMWLPLESDGIPIVGYGWAFPLPDGMANIGVGHLRASRQPKLVAELLDRFVKNLHSKDPRFHDSTSVSPPLGAPVRLGGNGASSFGRGCLLVGDSAGVGNPLWAEGIGPAVESGIVSSRMIVDHFSKGTPLSAYAERVDHMDASYGKLSRSLPAIYQSIPHVSRELAPFLGLNTPMARATVSLLDLDAPNRSKPTLSRGRGQTVVSAEGAVEDVRARLARVAGRDRPLFGLLLGKIISLDDYPSGAALALFAARSCFSSFRANDSVLMRVALCLESASCSAFLFSAEPHAEIDVCVGRGAPWLDSLLSLGLADRLLARCFSMISHLPEADRALVADRVESIVAAPLTPLGASRGSVFSASISAGAWIGSRFGSASPEICDRIADVATTAASEIFPLDLGDLRRRIVDVAEIA